MKTKTETNALEKLSMTAAISCACSVLYFLATTLLALSGSPGSGWKTGRRPLWSVGLRPSPFLLLVMFKEAAGNGCLFAFGCTAKADREKA